MKDWRNEELKDESNYHEISKDNVFMATHDKNTHTAVMYVGTQVCTLAAFQT